MAAGGRLLLKKILHSRAASVATWLAAALAVTAVFAWASLPSFVVSTIRGFETEERETGNLTKDLIDGLQAPTIEYHYNPHTTGQFLLGFFLYPFFRVFGQNIVAIKTMGAVISLATLLVWTGFAWRFLGRAGGLVMLAMFLAPPALYQQYVMTTFGNHKESMLFTGAILWAAYEVLRRARTRWGALGVGALGGFALFFCLQNAPAVAVVALLWLGYRGLRDWLLDMPWFVGGAVAAYAPFYAWYASAGVDPVPRFNRALGLDHPVAAIRDYLLPLFDDLLPRLFGVFGSDAVWPRYAMFVVMALALIPAYRGELAAWFRGAIRWRRRDDATPPPPSPAMAALAFLVGFPVLYTLGGYHVEEPYDGYNLRYLVPWYPFVFLAAALLAARLRRWWRVGFVILLALVWWAPSVWGTLGRYRTNIVGYRNTTWAEFASLKGTDYPFFLAPTEGFGRTLGRFPDDALFRESLAKAARIEPTYRWLAYRTAGTLCGWRLAPEAVALDAVPAEYRSDFVRGWGAGRAERAMGDFSRTRNVTPTDTLCRPFCDAEFIAPVGGGVGLRLEEIDRELQRLPGGDAQVVALLTAPAAWPTDDYALALVEGLGLATFLSTRFADVPLIARLNLPRDAAVERYYYAKGWRGARDLISTRWNVYSSLIDSGQYWAMDGTLYADTLRRGFARGFEEAHAALIPAGDLYEIRPVGEASQRP